jgi:hypothetical protein
MFSAPGGTFAPLFAIALVLVAMPIFAAEWMGTPLASGALTLASGLLSVFVQAIVVHVCLARLIAGDASTREALARMLPRFLSVVFASILFTLITIAGALLLVIPGIIAYVGLFVVLPALVHEEIGATDAISRSWELTSGYRWQILWILVLAGFFYLLLLGAALALASALEAGGAAPHLAKAAMDGLMSALLALLGGSLSAALYVELRTGREGGATEQLVAVFE